MCDSILEVLNKHKYLTFVALIALLDNLRNKLDWRNCAIGKFLEFQKAFDTVNNKIPLRICFGIRGFVLG